MIGMAGYCFVYRSDTHLLKRFNKFLLLLAPMAMLTGSLLVYPKHFTFHTPWIQAALLCSSLFMMIVLFLIIFQNKIRSKFAISMIYVLLFAILLIIAYDTVTKNTFII